MPKDRIAYWKEYDRQRRDDPERKAQQRAWWLKNKDLANAKQRAKHAGQRFERKLCRELGISMAEARLMAAELRT